MYKLHISPKVEKELKKISRREKEAVVIALQDIADDPLSGKPLTRELTGSFTYKVGVYRIIYRIDRKDKIVEIVTAGHRSTIYQ